MQLPDAWGHNHYSSVLGLTEQAGQDAIQTSHSLLPWKDRRFLGAAALPTDVGS